MLVDHRFIAATDFSRPIISKAPLTPFILFISMLIIYHYSMIFGPDLESDPMVSSNTEMESCLCLCCFAVCSGWDARQLAN
jgi:hypothetical protein